MKNVNIYIGELKKDVMIKRTRGRDLFIEETRTTTTDIFSSKFRDATHIVIGKQVYELKRSSNDLYVVVPIDKKVILIERKGTFYQYEDKLINNLMIYLNLWNLPILTEKPTVLSKLYYDKKTLVPYYDEQPKKLSFRKLKKDLLCDPRMKEEIED